MLCFIQTLGVFENAQWPHGTCSRVPRTSAAGRRADVRPAPVLIHLRRHSAWNQAITSSTSRSRRRPFQPGITGRPSRVAPFWIIATNSCGGVSERCRCRRAAAQSRHPRSRQSGWPWARARGNGGAPGTPAPRAPRSPGSKPVSDLPARGGGGSDSAGRRTQTAGAQRPGKRAGGRRETRHRHRMIVPAPGKENRPVARAFAPAVNAPTGLAFHPSPANSGTAPKPRQTAPRPPAPRCPDRVCPSARHVAAERQSHRGYYASALIGCQAWARVSSGAGTAVSLPPVPDRRAFGVGTAGGGAAGNPSARAMTADRPVQTVPPPRNRASPDDAAFAR